LEVYTIGFTQRTASSFFGALREAGIRRLLDIRLNNTSQLAGFAKRDDLAYFLRELCGAEYLHLPVLAPSQELLDGLKKRRGSWAEYERGYLALLAERRPEEALSPELFGGPTVLLCSEPRPDRCHRRLALEYLRDRWGDIQPVHL
jgi:uncharacterized protein (DUF488 family)